MEKRASGDRDILFEVHSIICVRVRTTGRYWRYVVEIKHPESFSDVEEAVEKAKNTLPVSYTHLTLPTKRIV